jgi:hypothetical protein
MKKLLLPLLGMLFSIQSFASLRQTNYRWRNDDGSETSATWKAAQNTPITINDTSTLRLRMELDNDNGELEESTVEDVLQYSTDNGITWVTMGNTPGQAFFYQASTNVANLQATTNQMGSGTFGTYVAGHVIAALPGASTMDLNDAERTELEWVIRPTASALPNTTYTFQVTGLEEGVINYAQINTGCIGVYVLSKHDSARCGPGMVQLSATCTSGSVVQWYDASTGGNLVGTGNTFTTPVLATTKTYYASAKLGTTCESPTRLAATATINPIPTVNLGNDVTVCANVPVTLNAGGNYAYLWDDGTTLISRTVHNPGNYFVTVTGIGNCKKSDTITVNYNPRPVVNLGNDTLICPGQIVTFDAGNPGDTYLWDDGSTGETRSTGATGNYSVVVTNTFNCTGTDIVHVTVKDLPLGEINAVHGDSATYTFDVSGALYAVDYGWDFGDGTPAVNGFLQHHTYARNGIYTVSLAMIGDCDTNAYRQRTVDVYDARETGGTGIGNPALKNAFNIYPNPSKEVIYVSFNTDLKVTDIDVYNVLGQKINATHLDSKTLIAVSTAGLTSGIYSMRINTDKGFVIQKFEVRK